MMNWRIYIIIFFAVLGFTNAANAQTIEGTIIDKDTREVIPYVTITNKRTKATAQSNKHGVYALSAIIGDTIFLSHPAYAFTSRIIGRAMTNAIIYIEKKRYELDEVEVLSDMAKFRKDSADRHTIYRKTLKDAGFKPGMGSGGLVSFDGLFTALAYKVSGKGKKNKQFAQMVMQDEQTRFTNVRYSKKVVMEQTKLNEAEAEQFIIKYPMPYEYVRAASDVEIKMWIRERYKDWQTSRQQKQ